MPFRRCPYCAELVSDERETCAACGTRMPDDEVPFERRTRLALVSALVLGAMLILSSFVRDWLASR